MNILATILRVTGHVTEQLRRPVAQLAGIVAIAIAALVLGYWTDTASAAVFAVNSTSDAVDSSPGNGVCRTSTGVCTLRAAIQEANATAGADSIQVPPGVYTITRAPSGSNTITTGDFDITRPLTITGAGAGATIIDGGLPPAGSPPERIALDRLFEIHPTAGDVTLRALTMAEGWDEKEGGAVYNRSRGTVRLESVSVLDSFASNNGGGIYNDGFERGRLIIASSMVAGNSTNGEGGGIYTTGGALTVTGTAAAPSAISGNAARNGGGVYNGGKLDQAGQRRAVELIHTAVSQNTALNMGGGVFNELEGDLLLSDVTVSDNAAAADGGGVASVSKSSLTLSRGAFTGNSSTGDGGGVYASTEGPVTIDAGEFSGNTAGISGGEAGGGGGLYTDGGSVAISQSTFSANSAFGEGGGIAIHNSGMVTISDSLVRDNTTEANGGGVLNSGTAVTFTGLIISGNAAFGNGGGVENQGSGDFIIDDTAIISNSGFNGGGFNNGADSPLSITTASFISNSAENGGGFHNAMDSPLKISRSAFWDNHAAQLGGAILDVGDAATELENVTVSGNSAGQSGGGLYVDGDAILHVVNATITANAAPVGSGVATPNGIVNFPVVPSTLAVFRNTIVAGNDCFGAFSSEGGNIDGGESCYFSDASDQVNTDPNLGALADNGGPSLTHALTLESPAFDAGVAPCPASDQRGIARPQGLACDSGAYELESALPNCGASISVSADADSWIDENSPSNNKGPDSVLKVQSKAPSDNFRALVHFAMPPNLPAGCVVQSATLSLYANSASIDRTLEVLRLSEAWSEDGVTWGNQPGTTGPAATAAAGAGYRAWDVTAQVQAMYGEGANHGFLVRDAVEGDAGGEQQLYSREKGENAPVLVISFAPTGP